MGWFRLKTNDRGNGDKDDAWSGNREIKWWSHSWQAVGIATLQLDLKISLPSTNRSPVMSLNALYTLLGDLRSTSRAVRIVRHMCPTEELTCMSLSKSLAHTWKSASDFICWVISTDWRTYRLHIPCRINRRNALADRDIPLAQRSDSFVEWADDLPHSPAR